jgi:hypothetical protein
MSNGVPIAKEGSEISKEILPIFTSVLSAVDIITFVS